MCHLNDYDSATFHWIQFITILEAGNNENQYDKSRSEIIQFVSRVSIAL